MQQGKNEVAGGLVIDLDRCMVAHADVDDRRHVFQVGCIVFIYTYCNL